MAALVAASWSQCLQRSASCCDRRNKPAVPELSYQPHAIAVLLREAEYNSAVFRTAKHTWQWLKKSRFFR